jgi:hypothetical protein
MRALVPIAAVIVCGLALYFTHSVLDVVLVDGRAVRVALLPGWPGLVAFVGMAALGVLWLARRSMPRTRTSAPSRLRVGQLTLPLLALAVLIVPFLPVLPDRLPALQLAAGPLKWVVWLAVGGLLFWMLWQGRVMRTDWLARLSLLQVSSLVGLATAIAVRIASGFAPLEPRDYAALLAGAVAAAVTWKFVVERTNAAGAATFAWAAVAFTAPFLFSAGVDRQMIASLIIVLGFALIPDAPSGPRRLARWAFVAAACALLSLLTFRNASSSEASPLNVMRGAPGLLFDQQYGLLAYAPVYILAATGLTAMIRAGAELRVRAVEIAVIVLVVLLSAGALPVWWGGTSAPARPLAPVLFLCALPMAFAVRRAAPGTAHRAGQYLLLFVSIGVALTMALAHDRLLLANARDGVSPLLEYWSTTWPAWAHAPAFAPPNLLRAWLSSILWIGGAFATGAVLSHWTTRSAGGATLVAVWAFAVALLVITSVVRFLPREDGGASMNLAARGHLTLLDGFDSAIRPIAILYDPFRFQPAAAIVPLASLSVAPGVRQPQPIRVLHNGRFSLPAGRYHLDVEWAEDMPAAVPMALQIGQVEPAWQTWTVHPQRGGRWSTDVGLPVDASFVALRGGTDLERAIGHVAIRPTEVIDASRRPRIPPILTTLQLGSMMVLFHDDHASQETTGFWVFGGQAARVTFARLGDISPLVLRVHSGLKANRVTLSMRGWQEVVYLKAGGPQDVTLADSERPVMTVEIRAEDGFHPKEFNPASPDPRFLGVWVEVAAAKP